MQEQGKNGLDDLGFMQKEGRKGKAMSLFAKPTKKEAKTIAINDSM